MIKLIDKILISIFSTADIVPNLCVIITVLGILKYSWFFLFLFFHERRLDIIKENIFFELEYLNIIILLRKLLKYFILKNIYYKEIYSSYLIITNTESEFYIFSHKHLILLFFYLFYYLILSNLIFTILITFFNNFNQNNIFDILLKLNYI